MNNIKVAQSDTKQLILDASEYFFAVEGFRGTTLRAVTEKAGVNLAAVNYHFGSKRSLLEEVIKRRIEPLNAVRRKKLETVRDEAVKTGKKPEVRDILAAFIEPTLLFKESNPEVKYFFAFIGRSFTDPDDTVRKVFLRFIKPIFALMYETMRVALPQFSSDLIFWRLHFSLGALFHTMHICENLKDEASNMKHRDAASLVELIIPYVTAGMKA